MKLTSKEISPVTVRDRLIKTFSNQDVCDLVDAVKWAEAKCLELNEKVHELEVIIDEQDRNDKLTDFHLADLV